MCHIESSAWPGQALQPSEPLLYMAPFRPLHHEFHPGSDFRRGFGRVTALCTLLHQLFARGRALGQGPGQELWQPPPRDVGCVARCGMCTRMRDARQDAGASAGGALPPSRRQGNRPPSPPTRGGPPQPPLGAGGSRPSLPRCWTAASPPPQRAWDGGGWERTSLGHGRSKRNAANLKGKGEGYVGCFVLDWQVESIDQRSAFVYIRIYLFIWESLFTWHR